MNATRMLFPLAVGFLLLCPALSQGASFPESEAEVLRLEELGRQKFLRGDPHWDDLIADGAYMVRWDGAVISYKKGQPLPAVPMKSIKLSEMEARAFGEVVVVTGLGEGEGETHEKKPFSFKSRFINVWKKLDGEWKIVVSQNTVVQPQQAK